MEIYIFCAVLVSLKLVCTELESFTYATVQICLP